MRTAHAHLALAHLAILCGSCSALVALPDDTLEEGQTVCMDGMDNDQDGESDCADLGCRAHCSSRMLTAPVVSDCFADADRGLALGITTIGPEGDLRDRCDWNPSRVEACADGTRLLPGATECRAPGSVCGEDEWPRDSDAAQHVRAGAMDGDGSADRPWATIAEAIAALGVEGGDVVLARGDHVISEALSRSVSVRGVCPSEVRLLGALRVESGVVELTDLTVLPEETPIEVVGALRAVGVVIDGRITLEGADASLELDDAWVRSSLSGATIEATAGGVLDLRASRVDGGTHGVSVVEGELSLSGVAIAETSALGLTIGPRAQVVGAGVVVEPAAGDGVEIACLASAARCAELDDLMVRGPRAATPFVGVRVRSGGVRLRRAHVSRTHGAAIEQLGGVVELEDSWIEGAENLPGATMANGTGDGVHVREGAEITVRRSFVWNNAHRGVRLEPGARAIMVSLEVLNAERSALQATCVEARSGSSLEMVQFALGDCGLCGLRLEEEVDPLSLSQGTIHGCARGTCLSPAADYPVVVLTRDVLYRDNQNDTNLYREER